MCCLTCDGCEETGKCVVLPMVVVRRLCKVCCLTCDGCEESVEGVLSYLYVWL